MKKLRNGISIDLTEEELAEFNQLELDRQNKYIDSYITQRQNEYPTTEDMVVALWKSVVELDNVSKEELQAKRLATQSKYPNPT